jgi:uncharacterized LabA/DUF88 family protein
VRFAIFVDGSNLFGTMKHMNARVPYYQTFFEYIFCKSVESWKSSLYAEPLPPMELRRVYWYAVGQMDDWNLADPKAQAYLKEQFDQNRTVKAAFMAEAGKKLAGQAQDKVALEAWSLCFNEFKEWYEKKWKILEGMRRFHFGVQRDCDFIEIITSARWKVEFFSKSVSEKGLDTALAVDMVTMLDNYDVAIVISGDADMIPSINYVKAHNKSVGVVEFLEGYPPKDRGKQSSSHLKIAADFMVRIYEMDLVQKKLAEKGSQDVDDVSVTNL